jgi:hypothetical protein
MALDRLPIAADQRLFLCAAPTFDLPLCRERLLARRSLLRPHKFHRATLMRITLDLTRLVLRDTALQLVGVPEVVGTVGATKHVDEKGFHASRFPRRMSFGDTPAWESNARR